MFYVLGSRGEHLDVINKSTSFQCYTIEAQCFYSMVGFMVFIYFCTKQSCHLDLKKATEIRKAVQDCINCTLCKLQILL